MGYPAAYQLYSSRMFPPLLAHLPKLKAMGYTAIEPWLAAYEDEPEIFRHALDKAKLECFGFHLPAMGLFNNLERFITYGKILKAQAVIPAYLAQDERPQNMAQWQSFAIELSKIAKDLAKHNLKLVWHNHDFEFIPLEDGSRGIDYLMGYENIQMEIDLAWIITAGGNPKEELIRFAHKIWIVQTKDKRPKGDDREFGFASPAQGIISWQEILPYVKKINPHHIVIEHDLPDNWENFAQSSITYLRKIGY